MMRVFIGTEMELDLDDDEDLVAQMRGHSGETARRMYSVEQGYMAMLTSDMLRRIRRINLEYHQVLDLRPGYEAKIPVMQRLRNRQTALQALVGAKSSSGGPVDAAVMSGELLEMVLQTMDALTSAVTGEIHKMGARLQDSMQGTVAQGVVHAIETQRKLLGQFAPVSAAAAVSMAAEEEAEHVYQEAEIGDQVSSASWSRMK